MVLNEIFLAPLHKWLRFIWLILGYTTMLPLWISLGSELEHSAPNKWQIRTVIPIFLMVMNYPFIIPLYCESTNALTCTFLLFTSHCELCRVVSRSFSSQILKRQKWINDFSFTYYRFHTTHHLHYSPPRFLPHFIAWGREIESCMQSVHLECWHNSERKLVRFLLQLQLITPLH